MLEHKGFLGGRVKFDSGANLLHGEVMNSPDVVTFQGETVAQLKQAFIDSVEAYLSLCKERGESPEPLFPDKLELQLDPTVYKSALAAAKEAEISLNDWIIRAIKNECHLAERYDLHLPYFCNK